MFALACVLVLLAALVIAAPANWLALAVESASDGHVLLADARGSVWSGDAVLALAGAASGGRQAWSLPGRLSWRFGIDGAGVRLELRHSEGVLQPFALHAGRHGVSLDAGQLRLPLLLAQLAGAPLNTMQPDGIAQVRWDKLDWSDIGGAPSLQGRGTVDIQGLTLRVSPVHPLGDYRIEWTGAQGTGGQAGVNWTLSTVSGPLRLVGAGHIPGAAPELRVSADAADVNAAQRLQPLLDMLGPRQDGQAVLRLGTI